MRIGVVAIALTLTIGLGAAQAEGVVPVEGSWGGESSAGLPVHFGVENGRVVNPRFKFEWGFCGTYESNWPGVYFEVDPNGHWVVEDSRGQTLEATFDAADKVEGTIVAVERMLPGCPRAEATFTAAPVATNPESFAAARAEIEALRFEIEIRGLRSENALVGKVRGRLGERFVFYLFVNRKAPRHLGGAPGFELNGLDGGSLAKTDELWSTAPGRGWTRGQKRERERVLTAVADTVCRRQTGSTCAPADGRSRPGSLRLRLLPALLSRLATPRARPWATRAPQASRVAQGRRPRQPSPRSSPRRKRTPQPRRRVGTR
jgi:hypothetical protein